MAATFRYTAVKHTGQKVKGAIEAAAVADAKAKLRALGLIVLQIEDTAKSGGKQLSMTQDQLTSFTFQLAQLLEADIPLADSLEVLEDQAEGEKQQPLIRALKEKVEVGVSFCAALQTYPKTFSHTYIAIMGAGETIGGFGPAAKRLALLLSRDAAMKNRLVTAMIYPILLTILLLIALAIMFFFVIPSIQELFEGKELPVFTQLIFSMSLFLNNHLWAIGSAALAFLGLIVMETIHPWIRPIVGEKALAWPLIGPFLIKSSIARFCRTLTTLLKGGTPLNIALERAEGTLSNLALIKTMKNAKERVLQGEVLSKAFDVPLIPKLFRRMVALGEETGRLEELIEQVAGLYEDETGRLLDRITSMIQPVLLILFGALIGSTLLAILLPLSNFGALLSQ